MVALVRPVHGHWDTLGAADDAVDTLVCLASARGIAGRMQDRKEELMAAFQNTKSISRQ
jgi:hypothetical protein